jgi:hypothetical protein
MTEKYPFIEFVKSHSYDIDKIANAIANDITDITLDRLNKIDNLTFSSNHVSLIHDEAKHNVNHVLRGIEEDVSISTFAENFSKNISTKVKRIKNLEVPKKVFENYLEILEQLSDEDYIYEKDVDDGSIAKYKVVKFKISKGFNSWFSRLTNTIEIVVLDEKTENEISFAYQFVARGRFKISFDDDIADFLKPFKKEKPNPTEPMMETANVEDLTIQDYYKELTSLKKMIAYANEQHDLAMQNEKDYWAAKEYTESIQKYEARIQEIHEVLKQIDENYSPEVTKEIKQEPENINKMENNIIENVRPFIPNAQFEVMKASSEFDERIESLNKIISKMPHTYQTDNIKANDKIVWLHYYSFGGSDWYIVEKDKGDPNDEEQGLQYQAYGYAILNGDLEMAEWGYISIEELRGINSVNLDLWFEPVKFSEVMAEINNGEEEHTETSTTDTVADILNTQTVVVETKSSPAIEFKVGNIVEAYSVPDQAFFRGTIEKIEPIENGVQYIVFCPDIGYLNIESPSDMRMLNEAATPEPEPEPVISIQGKSQEQVTEEVRKLIDEHGIDRNKYSLAELRYMRFYEGLGGLAKTKKYVQQEILDQFFTPNLVIQKMWGLAMKNGFNPSKPKRILESSCGTGRFFEYLPNPKIHDVTAYEIDFYAYAIAKMSFPDFNIQNKAFERFFFQGERYLGIINVSKRFDLVIGNPPYREFSSALAVVKDGNGNTEQSVTKAKTYDQYFIARGVDLLASGGLLVFIVPNTFLSNNASYNDFKNQLATKCDLIDAYRLPNGTFPNTQVGTDIIVLKKK